MSTLLLVALVRFLLGGGDYSRWRAWRGPLPSRAFA
jgi:hypothetical protein